MIADRFTLQQAWWLASELGRRHPELWIERMAGPQGPPLLVALGTGSHAEVRVHFTLSSGVRAFRGDDESHWSWETVFACPSAHDTLRRIEASTGLGFPERAPATTTRSIVYRLIARLLALHVDAQRPWLPVPVEVERMLHGRLEPEADPTLTGYATVIADVHEHRKDIAKKFDDVRAVHVRPWLWAMTRGVDTELVLDTDGYAHTRRHGAVRLLPLYDDLGRDIDRLAVRVLELAGAVRP